MKKFIPVFLIILLFQQISAQNFQMEDKWWMPNGQVNTVQADTSTNKIYAGGNFDMVGPRRPWNVHIRYKSGAINENAAMANDTVNNCLPDGNGGWFLSGKFTKIGDSIRYGLAHVDSAGKVTAFMAGATGVNGVIYSMALHAGKLYLGGKFSFVNNIARKNLAAIWVSNSKVAPWAPNPDERVLTLASKGNRIYAGGLFSMLDTANRFRLAAMDTGTGRVLNWNPGVNGVVTAIALYDTFVFICGNFSAAAYNPASGFAMFSQNSNKLLKNIAPSNYSINNIRIFGNVIYLLGVFSSVQIGNYPNNEFYYCISAYNLKNWNYLNLGFPLTSSTRNDFYINDLTLVKGVYYLCGGFSKVAIPNSLKINYRSRFLAFDSASKTILPMECNISDKVYKIAAGPSGLYACGEFISAGGVTRSNLVRYNSGGYQPDNWTVRTNNEVYALKVVKNKVFIGGKFTYVNDISRNNLGCFDNNANAITRFNPIVDGPVYAIENSNDKLIIGGEFYNVGALTRRNLAITDTALGYCFVAQLKSGVSSIKQIKRQGNKIYFAGQFDINGAGGILRTDTGKFYIDSAFLINRSELNGTCILPTNKSYYYGNSYYYNQTEYLFNADSATNKRITFNSKLNSYIYDMVLFENTLIAGGDFSMSGSIKRTRMAAFHLSPFTLDNFNPSPDGSVKTLATSGKRLFMGGYFNKSSGTWQRGFAVYTDICKLTNDTIYKTVCGNIIWNGLNCDKTGTYNATVRLSTGCMQNQTLNLKIIQNKFTGRRHDITGCNKLKYNNITYYNSGLYIQRLTNSIGCDSLDSLFVKIIVLNLGANSYTDSIYSQDPIGKYQWLDCDSQFKLILNANTRSFFPKKTGHFAVEINRFSCRDTSQCYYFDNSLGMKHSALHTYFQIYPNPVKDYINIRSPENINIGSIRILNTTGQVQLSSPNLEFSRRIDITTLKPGVYIFEGDSKNGKIRVPFQKL